MNNEKGRNLRAIVSAFSRRQRLLLHALFVALLSVLALTPTGARADPSAQVLGATIGEWSARWWQWAQSIDASINPLLDTDGTYCAQGQKGPVWFLGGTFAPINPPVERTCHVPAAKSIFFPIFNSLWVQTAWDDPTNTQTDLRECVAGVPGNKLICDGVEPFAGGLVATLRLASSPAPGRPIVFDTPIVRTQSPFFTLAHYPANSIWFNAYALPSWIFENGTSVSDGFWVMLPPLRRGNYVLYFSASAGGIVSQEVTYHLIID